MLTRDTQHIGAFPPETSPPSLYSHGCPGGIGTVVPGAVSQLGVGDNEPWGGKGLAKCHPEPKNQVCLDVGEWDGSALKISSKRYFLAPNHLHSERFADG